MNHMARVSASVYVGLCHEIGSPTEVRIRREVMETEDFVTKHVFNAMGVERMVSGSRREGFRLRTSDTDYMYWYPFHEVICYPSQISFYRIPQHTVILMECDDVPPGFTRLNLMTPSNDTRVSYSCVTKNNTLLISSTLFRYNYFKSIKNDSFFASSILHGPCSSNFKKLDFEFDFVMCFRSHHWPSTALSWIQRSRQQGWPSEIVLSEILRGGFHVVPIGSTPENGLQWRISFSLAEKTLVYSMNHCQFLCYALLKIFLKEVINYEMHDPVLCSYFMKTIVFWVIQRNCSTTWKPQNLLSYFWECFQLLIYWVRRGECPNFFIPENNMFRVKVTGSVKISLSSQLQDLYCKGISCLLLSPTLRPYLSKVILNRTIRVCTDESSIISSTGLDISFFNELKLLETCRSLKEFPIYIILIEKLIKENLTPYQAVTLQYMTSEIFRSVSLLIQNSRYSNTNRTVYYDTSKISALLKLSCTIGCASDILYLAVYFYRTRRYELSISCLQKSQERLSVPYIVYDDKVNQGYEYYMAGISLDNKIKRALVFNIEFHFAQTYFDELVLEQRISHKNDMSVLLIPPLVMLHMLFILNHHRLGDTVRSQQSLQDLQILLLYDDNVNVPYHYRDISWQILGICQQLCGIFSASLQSYQCSLHQYPLHKIKEATLFRMNTLPYCSML